MKFLFKLWWSLSNDTQDILAILAAFGFSLFLAWLVASPYA